MKHPYKKIILVIISLILSHLSFGQQLDVYFGNISQEEIAMKSYEKDTLAKAVILFDKGNTIFFDAHDGYDIRFSRHKRIKIFDKSESQYAEVSIPYYVDGYGKTEVVQSIEAVTYNVIDGVLIERVLDPSSVFDEQINERWHRQKFVFPDVQDGSILEYRYVVETPFYFNLPDWTFQDKIPTVYSEYEVSMIPFYEYTYLLQGVSKFYYQNSEVADIERVWGSVSEVRGQTYGGGVKFKDYVHTYALKDIPAFNDESYISSINDYIIKMDFQLAKFYSPGGGSTDIMSTWPALNEALLKHEKFGKYLKIKSKIAEQILLEELDLVGKDDRQKAKEIIDYVKSNFEWDGSCRKYASQSPKDFFNKKLGNSADINLFMIALLNKANIDTNPLIISTRDHGRIPSDYPFDHFTNYVIAMVNTDSPFLADGTEELLPYNKLPIRCKNKIGLIVEKEDTHRWISLENDKSSLETNKIIMKLDTSSMDLVAQVLVQSTEYESYSVRKKFKDDSLKITAFYSDRIGDITKLKTVGYDRIGFPYSMYFNTTFETEKLGDNVVIRPFLNLPLSKNTLTQDKRDYPIDFIYPWENKFQSTLEIPTGFSFTELPEGYSLDNELAEVNLKYYLNANILTVHGNYKFKKSIYVASEYSQVKDYMDQVVRLFNQAIVLEKSN